MTKNVSQEKEGAGPSPRSAKLPEEIIETQKSRSDLLKWKLLLVAALGGVGLGLMEKIPATPLLLALIPFGCIYVDLLCASLKLRLMVIGTYYAAFYQDDYEGFVGRIRRIFDLEDWALYWSTACVSFLVAMIGVVFILNLAPMVAVERGSISTTNAPATAVSVSTNTLSLAQAQTQALAIKAKSFQGWILAAAGAVGLLVSLIAQTKSRSRASLLQTQVPLARHVMHNRRIAGLLRPQYSAVELEALRQFLINQGVFAFTTLPNGLFPAAGALHAGHASGYQYTWVRDNVHVAHAHFASGDTTTAVRAVAALMRYFQKHRRRFEDIIEGRTDAAVAMNRPHVRFDGETLEELKQKWPHAQNDALGYFLWLYCKLARQGLLPRDVEALACLQLFPRYFQAIEFWKDLDSGHWEEARKVSASSIGTVLAGLRELKMLLMERSRWAGGEAMETRVTSGLLGELQTKGEAALREILPCESIAPEAHYRRHDAALLFLIYPLEILEDDQADQILRDVTTHLQGEHGIRRYLGDSYWCADFEEKLTPELRTGDFSESTKARDALLHPGEEAQWCLFDPIVSVIHGRRYLQRTALGERQRAMESLRLQAYHLNRSLGQLSDKAEGKTEFRCPEAYYLKKGRYVPNEHTPLLWAQANLWLAIHAMEESVRRMEEA